MSLVEKINADIKSAMKAKNKSELRGLRSIKAAILLLQTKTANKNINEHEEIKLLQKLAKQRKDSIETYEKSNRADLANDEKEELEVIQKYLPKQLNKDELKSELEKMVNELEIKSLKDIGKIMPMAMKKLGAVSDGRTISLIIKEIMK